MEWLVGVVGLGGVVDGVVGRSGLLGVVGRRSGW